MLMFKRTPDLLTAFLLAIALLLTGCEKNEMPTHRAHQTITDLIGRSVTLQKHPRRVACIGAGALRLYAYVGDLNRLCGVEQCEKRFLISARPYQMVHAKTFKSLPAIGLGGPGGRPDAEALLRANPDVVFTTYTQNPPDLDRLQKKIGAPVVALSYGYDEATDPNILKSLNLIGQILDNREKAEKLTDYILKLHTDLDNRTKDIPKEESPSVYLACHSHFGAHGFGSSSANFSLFNAVHARNILLDYDFKGYQKKVQIEAVLLMNPQIIFVDAAGLPILKQEFLHHRRLFTSMDAFKRGSVYVQMPYNAYHTNLEIAYMNAYFIAKTIYPKRFKDIDMAQKAGEISRMFLGQDIYPRLTKEMKGGFRTLTLKELAEDK